MPLRGMAYVFLVLEKHTEVVIVTKYRMCGQTPQEYFMHRHRFLEHGEIFAR